jgi:hypothetical protein
MRKIFMGKSKEEQITVKINAKTYKTTLERNIKKHHNTS